MKKYLLTLILIPMMMLAVPITYSDDTDIYIFSPDEDDEVAITPLLMFILDYRPNVINSSVCTGGAEAECEEIFEAVGLEVWDGTGDIDYFTQYQPGNVVFLELLRAVLKKVLLIDEIRGGVRLGMMLAHDHQQNCDGPEQDDCSNAAYVALGFNTVTSEEGYVAQVNELFNILTEMVIEAKTGAENIVHPYQGKEIYFELFRYLTGGSIFNGHNGWVDYGYDYDGDDPKNLDENKPELSWDETLRAEKANHSEYNRPDISACANITVINIFDGVTQQEDGADDEITSEMTGIDLSGNNNNLCSVVGWMRGNDLYPNAADGEQNVTSYFFYDFNDRGVAESCTDVDCNLPRNRNNSCCTVAVGGNCSSPDDYARDGGTVSAYNLNASPSDLEARFESIFKGILNISTTFVSATVPVNVFNRSESSENVFFGMFQPEAAKQWVGNVKRLKLFVNPVNGVLEIHDVNGNDTSGNDVMDPATGRIKTSALTFWTNVDDDTLNGNTDEADDGKDGRAVTRGGAGQNIPGFGADTFSSPRTLYVDSTTIASLQSYVATDAMAEALWDDALCHAVQGSICTSYAASTTVANYTNGYLNATAAYTDAEKDQIKDSDYGRMLIEFSQGQDVFDHDKDDSAVDARPWLFQDILHGQPAPVNYGASGGYDEDNPNLRILITSNDGYVRMILNNDVSGNPDGSEVWAFIPREALSILGEHAAFPPDEDTDHATRPHPYGTDGSISIWYNDINGDGTIDWNGDNDNDGNGTAGDASDVESVWAFFGMRRGGYAYYGLDISNPDAPELMWRIKKESEEGDDFYEMGQSWSKPRVRYLQWDSNAKKPVLIFGGGYDPQKDNDSDIADGYYVSSSTTVANASYADRMGNALFIVDAETGELVWKAVRTGADSDTVHVNASLKDSIPSDTTPTDDDGDGIVDHVYVGDTGGVVWRADLTGTDRMIGWTIKQILSVGRHATSPDQQPDRRFFHRPDIVPAFDSDSDGAKIPYNGVLVGSGNRADPKDVYSGDFEGEKDLFIMLKDREVVGQEEIIDYTLPAVLDDLADLTETTVTSSYVASTTTISDGVVSVYDSCPSGVCTTYDKLRKHGWYIELEGEGEKMLSTSVTYLGSAFLSTYLPFGGAESDVCAPKEGDANSYAIRLEDASPIFNFDNTGDNDRSVITGKGIPSDPIIISKDGNIYLSPGNLPTTPAFRDPFDTNKLRKTYWYEVDE